MKIVIASGKGGVGKSMLTSALAMFFTERYKVVAVDCDVDAPNLAIWLNEIGNWHKVRKISVSEKAIIDYKRCDGCGVCAEKCRFEAIKIVNNKPKLNPFLCEGCGVCEIVCPQKAIKLESVKNGRVMVKKTKYGFWLIAGQLFPGETGSGKIITEIKKQALAITEPSINKDEIVILDSAPGTGCPVIASLQNSDFVVLVTEPTPSAFADLKRVLKLVNHFKLPWRLVLNKWDINKDLSARIIKWSGKRFLGKISYDKKIFKAISELKPVLETDLKVKKEIQKIYNFLLKHINQMRREH